jgi:hypothetical protein
MGSDRRGCVGGNRVEFPIAYRTGLVAAGPSRNPNEPERHHDRNEPEAQRDSESERTRDPQDCWPFAARVSANDPGRWGVRLTAGPAPTPLVGSASGSGPGFIGRPARYAGWPPFRRDTDSHDRMDPPDTRLTGNG